MFPSTVIVGVIFSVLTIRRRPLGKVMSVDDGGAGGISSASSRDPAHEGNSTGFVGAEVNCSPPPNPLEATGAPDGTGFSSAVIEFWSTRYCFATRFTSAGVTRLIASTSSSGELRPSAASASDHASAKPGMELRRNSAPAISRRLAASTSSAGTPFAA